MENSAIPKWNFHKILINKEGKIQNTYTSLTKPTSKKITSDIENVLNKKMTYHHMRVLHF